MVYVAIALGACFGTYWLAQIVFVWIHLRWTNRDASPRSGETGAPVSIIHPIKDLDFELEQNLESWFSQHYPAPLEHVFSFQDPDDAALPIVRRVAAGHPEVDTRILVNPVIAGLNGKSSNMVHALAVARHDLVLFGDSDARVRPDFVWKMARPLADERVGVTTCGQVNLGGRTFWTRFFTFIQNCETDFNWAFLTRLRMDIGITGAAFAMRRQLIASLGGLERFGTSLLEDMFLGNRLYRDGYAIVLGPFVECHVDRFEMEKGINYARRLAIGIRRHLGAALPLFVVMLSWYWLVLITALLVGDRAAVWLGVGFVGLRVLTGVLQRLVTGNRVLAVDLVMPLMFDLVGTWFLLVASRTYYVTWRGIRYRVNVGGDIEDASPSR